MREKRGSLLYQRVRPFGQKWAMIKWIECHGRPWKLFREKRTEREISRQTTWSQMGNDQVNGMSWKAIEAFRERRVEREN